MRRRQHSRAGLFLIELMITILFFSITAAICMRVFVKSRQISQDADRLFRAQAAISSVAEILEGSGNFSKDLSKCYPHLVSKTQTGYLLYLDESWEETTKEKASYAIGISWVKNGDMTQVKLQAFASSEEDFFSEILFDTQSHLEKEENAGIQNDNSPIADSGSHQEIYHLDLQIYNAVDGLEDGEGEES